MNTADQRLERHYLKQYARAWYLLKLHGTDPLNAPACDLLMDVINLRERDIETLRADARQLEEAR